MLLGWSNLRGIMGDRTDEAARSSGNAGRLAVLALAVFAAFTCLMGLGHGPALGDHECINAQAARQIRQSGEWLIPRLGEIPRIRKTPLGIWLIAAASPLIDKPGLPPISEVAARLPSALAAFGTTFVVLWLGTMMYGRRAGILAGFIWAASVAAILFARNAQVDMVLTFFTALSFGLFWAGFVRRTSAPAILGFFTAFALAMMAKAPLPLVTVGFALFVYWFVTVPLLAATEGTAGGPAGIGRRIGGAIARQVNRLPLLWTLLGLVVFVIVAGAWPLYVYRHVPNALSLWRAEYLDRATGDLSEQKEPFFYYVPIILGFAAPYTLSVFEAVAAPFLPRYRRHRRALAFAFTWAIVGTLVLSIPSFKRSHYVLSVMPGYCLLLAPVIERLFFGELLAPAHVIRVTCAVLPVALAGGFAAGGFFVRREFPTLLHAYVLAAVVALVIWGLACWTFATGRRRRSFVLVNLGVVALLTLIWPAVGRHVQMNAGADALADALRRHGITPDDDIVLVDGRPDASIEFYHGFRVKRLIDEIEMTRIRRNRIDKSMNVYLEIGDRIAKRLAAARPVYLILSAANYALLEANLPVRPRVVFRLHGTIKDRAGGVVVITQPSPATRAAASSVAGTRP
jgi:4-amino-4-deoxy-L-arabinose transferase-like glycosyltransferase